MFFRYLTIPLFLSVAACGDGASIWIKTDHLEVAPIEGLPAYRAGQILHPWHSDKPARDRYPQQAVGKADDPLCWLGDSYYKSCLIRECATDHTCPSGADCVDASLMLDPEGSPDPTTDPSGYPVVVTPVGNYRAMHLAVCVQ